MRRVEQDATLVDAHSSRRILLVSGAAQTAPPRLGQDDRLSLTARDVTAETGSASAVPDETKGVRTFAQLGVGAAVLALLLHLPFVLRYDLHFQADFAVSVMISAAIVEGERPVYYWGQGYLGTLGNYLTAIVFRAVGVSVLSAALVSLVIWSIGVGLATALAERLLDRRAAVWVGLAAAVASPYANHYISQPYSSYETAPLLAVLALAGAGWAARALASPLGARAVAIFSILGFVLGLGWWTTRLFLPAACGAALALALRGKAPGVSRGRAAFALGILAPAMVVGAAPDVLYRLGHLAHTVVGGAGSSIFEFEIAEPSMLLPNLRHALGALPAYFNGDPQARMPEGITFIETLAHGGEPYAGPKFEPGVLMKVHDRLVVLGIAAVLVAAAHSVVRAWRCRNVATLALGLLPFVHLTFIVLSGRTSSGYYEARRYWFASLLVFPLLFGNAMALTQRLPRAVRLGIGALAGVWLLVSIGAQVRMLFLPDELRDHRMLVQELTRNGERSVVMLSAEAWVIRALSGGGINAVSREWRRHEIHEVARSEHILLVLPAAWPRRARFTLAGRAFVVNGPSRRIARWQAHPYRAER